ncbi:MAG: DUF1573 domain-containing protein [Mariprofundus sp.]|nr:DUF1573 domain-containing protein [Mariprofundus sp.]
MRLILLVLALLLTSCSVDSGSLRGLDEDKVIVHGYESNKLQSKLIFEPDVIDAGSVLEGEKAVLFLRVRNSAGQMMSISSVTTSCGCSVAEPEQHLLMPGAFTRVKVTIDTFAKQDGVQKWVELTDDAGGRSRAKLMLDVKANPHMQASNRTIFDGKCAACHFSPAKGKQSGATIYQAVCVMCHGKGGEGAYAPKLAGIMGAASMAAVIAAGTGSQHMPGFSQKNGGPLNAAQIGALSAWLSKLSMRGEE